MLHFEAHVEDVVIPQDQPLVPLTKIDWLWLSEDTGHCWPRRAVDRSGEAILIMWPVVC